jgi:hypothetical protein
MNLLPVLLVIGLLPSHIALHKQTNHFLGRTGPHLIEERRVSNHQDLGRSHGIALQIMRNKN